MADDSSRVLLGKVGRPHGIHGEVRLVLHNPDSDSLREGLTVYLGPGAGALEQEEKALTIATVRPHKQFQLVTFKGLTHRDQVDALKHRELSIAVEDLPDLDEEEFYHRDILGLPVYVADEEDGELPDGAGAIGTVHRFFETGANDVLVVALEEGGTLFVPVIEQAISFIDLDEKLVVLQPLDLWTPA